jgi:hypothetical protein
LKTNLATSWCLNTDLLGVARQVPKSMILNLGGLKNRYLVTGLDHNSWLIEEVGLWSMNRKYKE